MADVLPWTVGLVWANAADRTAASENRLLAARGRKEPPRFFAYFLATQQESTLPAGARPGESPLLLDSGIATPRSGIQGMQSRRNDGTSRVGAGDTAICEWFGGSPPQKGFTTASMQITASASTGTSLKKRNQTWLLMELPSRNSASSMPHQAW